MTAAGEWLFWKDVAFLAVVGVMVFSVVLGSFEGLVSTTSTGSTAVIVLAALAAFGAARIVGWAVLGW